MQFVRLGMDFINLCSVLSAPLESQKTRHGSKSCSVSQMVACIWSPLSPSLSLRPLLSLALSLSLFQTLTYVLAGRAESQGGSTVDVLALPV